MSVLNYIGTGITFPIELDSKGFPIYRSNKLLIESSIKMILSWPTRSRIFLDEFGSQILQSIGEPNDDVLKGLVEHFVIDSLTRWEPRIRVTEVVIDRTSSDKLDVSLTYIVKVTGLADVLTFPFYKNIPY